MKDSGEFVLCEKCKEVKYSSNGGNCPLCTAKDVIVELKKILNQILKLLKTANEIIIKRGLSPS